MGSLKMGCTDSLFPSCWAYLMRSFARYCFGVWILQFNSWTVWNEATWKISIRNVLKHTHAHTLTKLREKKTKQKRSTLFEKKNKIIIMDYDEPKINSTENSSNEHIIWPISISILRMSRFIGFFLASLSLSLNVLQLMRIKHLRFIYFALFSFFETNGNCQKNLNSIPVSKILTDFSSLSRFQLVVLVISSDLFVCLVIELNFI